MEDLFVIVGLGNPGSKYECTRHNVGFNAIDLLASRHGIKVTKLKHKALIGEGKIRDMRVILVKPQTFMNLSGESVREVIEWFKVPMDKLVVIYDDVDLPLGKVRIRPNGSSGTHNGMKSIIYQLQQDCFPRIRIGIDKAPESWELADYVLSKFGSEERKTIEDSLKKAADAAEIITTTGVIAAMNEYNGL